MSRLPKPILLLLVVVVSLMLSRVARTLAADGDVVIDVLPAVKTAVKAEAGGDKIVEFRRDTENGNVGYVVVAQGKQGEYQMRFDTAGVLTRKWVEGEAEDSVKLMEYDRLPKPVRETLADQLRGGQAKTIVLREIKPTYEVRALIGGKYYDIRLDAAGKLIEKNLSNNQEAE